MRIRGIDITRKRVITVILLAAALIFLFQLVRINLPARVSSDTVKDNLKMISEYNFSSVTDVEQKLDEVNSTDPPQAGVTKSGISKAKYRQIFDGSVVVGDSITEGLTEYGFLDDGQVFGKVGASIIKDGALFTGASATYPKHAFFSFGMNDMGNYRGDSSAFMKKYKGLLDQFHKDSPKTVLYVNSISTPSAAARKKNKSLRNYKKFNAALRTMCSEMGITYIDNNYILECHPEYYGSDGIHVSQGYYRKWLNNMILKAGL